MNIMQILYTPLEAVLAWPRNPKKHDAKAMDASIERFGFNDPPTIDEATGRLVEGHGRIEALKRRKDRQLPPPARVTVERGEWMVPIVRGVSFRDELEAEAYLLAHNKVGADLWDDAALVTVLSDAQASGGLEGMGWSDADADRLRAAGLEKVAPEMPAADVSTGYPESMPSHVRMVQLFLDEDTHPRFMEAIKKLARGYGLTNATDTALRCLEDAAAELGAPHGQ